MKKNNKYRPIFIIAGLFLIMVILGRYLHNRLGNEGVLCHGTTLEWAFGSGGLTLKYEFTYQGKKHYSDDPTGKIMGNIEFLNRNFPVMYDPKTGLSQILIQPSDFKKYGLEYPDSLKWVLPYFK
jgi:hypothetical protein